MTKLAPTAPPPAHIAGLDTLRFVAAGWVALSHGARLPLEAIAADLGFGRPLAALNNGLFNGVAAVMVFFVLSGLVIHLPQAGGAPLDPLKHWTRRLTRILPPMLAASLIVALMGETQSMLFRGILWSVWCEIAYYALYPLLLLGFRRYGTRDVTLMTSALSLSAIMGTWPASYHSQLDLIPLLVIGLPSWCLGCLLAERLAGGAPLGRGPIWLWRAGALALSAALKVPVTHGPLLVGYPASHWLFAIFAYFWLMREIDHFRRSPPPAVLERLGAMSYSLYLVHMPALALIGSAPIHAGSPLASAGLELLRWGAQILAIVIATKVFYTLVEAPSHRFARTLSARVHSATRIAL